MAVPASWSLKLLRETTEWGRRDKRAAASEEGGEKVTETGGDDVATVDEIGRGAIIRQAINVVRDETGDRQGEIGEKEEGGGRVRWAEGTAKHLGQRKGGKEGHTQVLRPS